MKKLILIIILACCLEMQGQEIKWLESKDWKFYNVKGDKGLRLSIDSLVRYPFISINPDTLSGYIKQLDIWPMGKRSVWMGAYYASFNLEGVLHKLDISVYGGFVYDEVTKRFYQLPNYLRNEWMEWLTSMKARVNELP